MELSLQTTLTMCLGLLSIVSFSVAKKDKAVFCGACLAIVEEINQAIARVDPKKKIQVGSFRIDAQGNQDLREVPYGRSDVHLSEQFDDVCNKMYNYGLAKNEDPKSKKKLYIRKYAADGTMISSDSANFDEAVTKQLKAACEDILEHFEEDMMALLKDKDAEFEKKICVEELEFCKENDITERLWAQASAVMAGMKEKADEARDEAEGYHDDNDDDNDEDDDDFEEPTDDDSARPADDDLTVMTDGEIPEDGAKEEL